MTEKNNNWPRKHHGEHNSAGRTGNTNFDTPGLKGREDDTYAKAAFCGADFNNDIFGRIANIFINRDEVRNPKK
ncbi:hypothetical protein KYI13_09120 [Macrococcoides bohemicum]|uniref:hypothetical protein n=1 Tax=Macrococcoides bohemicum TaxID=1903056 RepID=UPI001C5D8505|nr:hypothetical protein [Macrococcus bohemicus]QYA44226.1 hypothetical protein KYI13_09120 [Macrococcus bohemicus]